MALRQFFYVSRAVGSPSEFDLRKLLQLSQRNNRILDVTGCLLFSGRHYAQVIEGEGAALDGLIARLESDPRHGDLTVVADGEIASRDFPDWSMGFVYKLDTVDRIDALLAAGGLPEEEGLALKAEMRTDSVLGAL